MQIMSQELNEAFAVGNPLQLYLRIAHFGTDRKADTAVDWAYMELLVLHFTALQ